MVDWSGSMISPVDDFGGAPILRREVTLDDGHGALTEATLHISSAGVFEASIDGAPVERRRPQPGLEQLRVAAPLPHATTWRAGCGTGR